MPQSGAEAGLDRFTPSEVVTELTWRTSIQGESGADPKFNGTLTGMVDLSEFCTRFEEYKLGYLLIARAQKDGSVPG